MSAPLIFPKRYVYECSNCHSDIEVLLTNGPTEGRDNRIANASPKFSESLQQLSQ
jgi:hypothetical protein